MISKRNRRLSALKRVSETSCTPTATKEEMKTRGGWRTCTPGYQEGWRGAELWHVCTMLSRDQIPLQRLAAPAVWWGGREEKVRRMPHPSPDESTFYGCSAGTLGVTRHTGPAGHSHFSHTPDVCAGADAAGHHVQCQKGWQKANHHTEPGCCHF